MGYYVRVLSTAYEPVPYVSLKSAIGPNEGQAKLEIEAGDTNSWEQLILAHADGTEIAVIERNPVEVGSLGSAEIDEFAAEIEECKPASSVDWLRNFFENVRCIYAFQVLSGVDHLNGWDVLNRVKNAVFSYAPSIIQADGEGFSNEAGYHILWQFSNDVEGSWHMAVMGEQGWITFEMDLANQSHREAFMRGEVPEGIRRLSAGTSDGQDLSG